MSSASASGANAQADLYTVIDIANEATALSGDQIDYVVIYKATGPGAGFSNTTRMLMSPFCQVQSGAYTENAVSPLRPECTSAAAGRAVISSNAIVAAHVRYTAGAPPRVRIQRD